MKASLGSVKCPKRPDLESLSPSHSHQDTMNKIWMSLDTTINSKRSHNKDPNLKITAISDRLSLLATTSSTTSPDSSQYRTTIRCFSRICSHRASSSKKMSDPSLRHPRSSPNLNASSHQPLKTLIIDLPCRSNSNNSMISQILHRLSLSIVALRGTNSSLSKWTTLLRKTKTKHRE